jgi:5S rRNA maturation endonuclease (ribonuclease M5)
MNTLTKKSRSIDQVKIKFLCDAVCDNIEEVLDFFELDYKVNGKMINMCCPIHGGDNPSAISLYPDGDNIRGYWKCRTHGCEKTFISNIVGFIRGLLSHREGWEKPGDHIVSFEKAIEFAEKAANKSVSSISVSRSDRDKYHFLSVSGYINERPKEKTQNKVQREYVRQNLQIPAQYYLDRGYSAEILEKYDVGLCLATNKPMSNRVVVPVYDQDHKYMIGSTGRSVHEKCNCGHFHAGSCPSKENAWQYAKWKHSKDFKSKDNLYNYWFAKEHILETMTAIIVESPGNVWRLEEAGIHNSVAIFGSSMSDRQKVLLDGSGAMNLVVLTDNDEAGKKAAEQIAEKCKNTYNVHVPTFSKADIGEMTIEEINEEIKPLLEKLV